MLGRSATAALTPIVACPAPDVGPRGLHAGLFHVGPILGSGLLKDRLGAVPLSATMSGPAAMPHSSWGSRASAIRATPEQELWQCLHALTLMDAEGVDCDNRRVSPAAAQREADATERRKRGCNDAIRFW